MAHAYSDTCTCPACGELRRTLRAAYMRDLDRAWRALQARVGSLDGWEHMGPKDGAYAFRLRAGTYAAHAMTRNWIEHIHL